MRKQFPCRPPRSRRGFTLFELIASLAAASVLMVGLSSALFIAVQAVDVSDSPHLKLVEAHALLADMRSDLQFATAITDFQKDSITFAIPDRDDADTLPDTVTYAWAGNDRDLTRQYNGGAVAVVADAVFHLEFSYSAPDGVMEYVTIELELIDDPNVFVMTSIPMLNRP